MQIFIEVEPIISNSNQKQQSDLKSQPYISISIATKKPPNTHKLVYILYQHYYQLILIPGAERKLECSFSHYALILSPLRTFINSLQPQHKRMVRMVPIWLPIIDTKVQMAFPKTAMYFKCRSSKMDCLKIHKTDSISNRLNFKRCSQIIPNPISSIYLYIGTFSLCIWDISQLYCDHRHISRGGRVSLVVREQLLYRTITNIHGVVEIKWKVS